MTERQKYAYVVLPEAPLTSPHLRVTSIAMKELVLLGPTNEKPRTTAAATPVTPPGAPPKTKPTLEDDTNDEEDPLNMSPEALIALRKMNKGRHTRNLREIADLLKKRGSKRDIQRAKQELVECTDLCRRYNSAYRQVAELDGERIAKVREWGEGLQATTEQVLAEIDEHLKSRTTPSVSSISTTASERLRRQKQLELENKRRELEHQRKVLELERARSKLDEEMERLKMEEENSIDEEEAEQIFKELEERVRNLKRSTPVQDSPFEEVFGPGSRKFNSAGRDFNNSLSLAAFFSKQQALLRQLNGDPREWPLFIANFKFLIHDFFSDDGVRIVHLSNALAPHVCNRIVNLLTDSSTYLSALKALKQKYGHPFVVAKCHIDSLAKIPAMKSDDTRSLREFSEKLNASVAAISVSEYEGELRSTTLLTQLLEKIPLRLRREWGEVVMSLLPNAPSLSDFDRWMERVALRDLYSNPSPIDIERPKDEAVRKFRYSDRQQRSNGVFSTIATESATNCIAYSENHAVESCPQILEMTPEARTMFVKSQGRCYRCLEKGHRGTDCKSSEKCGVDGCKASHHRILHGAPRFFPRKGKIESQPISTCLKTITEQSEVLFSVVLVILEANAKSIETWAILDKTGDSTFIDKKLSSQLNLHGKEESGAFSTAYGSGPQLKYKLVNFKIKSRDRKYEAHVTDAKEISKLSISNRFGRAMKSTAIWPHLTGIAFMERPYQVHVLIGRDVDAHDIYELRKPPVGEKGQIAELTPFGWCLTGKVPVSSKLPAERLILTTVRDCPDLHLDEMVKAFISHDSFGVRELPLRKSPEELRCLDILNATTRHLGDRYESGLLWKNDTIQLPDNRVDAERKLYALERRIARDSSDGHARKFEAKEIHGCPDRTWYLSHHGVTHPARPEALRIVFNASAKFHGTSRWIIC